MPRTGSEVTATITRVTREQGVFAVRDLSPDGARLVGHLDLFEQEQVVLTIALEPPLQIGAEVTHVDRQRKLIEVAFRAAGDARAHIERSIAELIERVRASASPTVLIVHPSVEVSSALERDLARVAVAARVIATLPTELDPSLIAVILAGSFGEALGPLLEHLEHTRPDVRRVILFGDQIEKIDHPAASRVDAVLRTPWHFKGLARALDLPSDSVVTTYDQLVALEMPIGKPRV
jgi:hypothetical protein